MTDATHPAGHILQAFHDGELDSSLIADVESHCEKCAACRAELADLDQMKQMLAASSAPELPRTVWHRVRPGQPRESRFKPAFGIAACALGIILGLLFGPVQFNAEKAGTELALSETVDLWDGGTTSPLLAVFQSGQN
jgi:anti-sigma factor RsiW